MTHPNPQFGVYMPPLASLAGMRVLLVFLAVVAVGCHRGQTKPGEDEAEEEDGPGFLETPYQPLGFKGGYVDRKVGPRTYEIEVRGNAHTSSWRIEGYFLRRAKELCKKAGFPAERHVTRDWSDASSASSDFEVAQTGYRTFSVTRLGGGLQLKPRIRGAVYCLTAEEEAQLQEEAVQSASPPVGDAQPH